MRPHNVQWCRFSSIQLALNLTVALESGLTVWKLSVEPKGLTNILHVPAEYDLIICCLIT